MRGQDQPAACRSGPARPVLRGPPVRCRLAAPAAGGPASRRPASAAMSGLASGLARRADSVISAVWILAARWSGIGGAAVRASRAGTIARSSRTRAHREQPARWELIRAALRVLTSPSPNLAISSALTWRLITTVITPFLRR